MHEHDESDPTLHAFVPTSDRIWVQSFDERAAQAFSDSVLRIAERDSLEPIPVYIDSYGGSADGLSTMLSVMDSVLNPFVTIATGKAMSAGAILLSHGNLRCVGIHARVMIHEVSGSANGNINDLQVDTEELARINEYYMELLARNCGKKLPTLKKLLDSKRETYMSAAEAVKFGIADHIGIPTIQKYTHFDLKFVDQLLAQHAPNTTRRSRRS